MLPDLVAGGGVCPCCSTILSHSFHRHNMGATQGIEPFMTLHTDSRTTILKLATIGWTVQVLRGGFNRHGA